MSAKVALREINEETVRTICKLSVTDAQQVFVAPNAVSIAQAHFSPQAWFRAIYADETPVGFVMLREDPDKLQYFLWRMMIDSRYQGNGYGRLAMLLVIERVKTRPNATQLLTSVVQEPGGPQRFYEGLGFKLTGKHWDDEAIMRLIF